MRRLFSLRRSIAPPRLSATLAANLDPHALERSVAAMQSLWEEIPLDEPWSANNHRLLNTAADR